MSFIANGVEIYDESNGLIVSGKALDKDIPTTANKFAQGCEILGVDGKIYKNNGTVLLPVWQNVDEIVSDEINPSVIQVKELVLSSADIKGMFAAPITVVPAVSGKVIVVDDVVLKITPGAVAYTGGGDIMVGNGDANCITAIPKALILSVADGTPLCSIAKGINISGQEAEGLDLRLTNADAAFATGTVGGSIIVRYHLV